MCGRYQLGNPSMSDLAKMVGFDAFDEHGVGMPLPHWNIAPMQTAPVFRVGAEGTGRLSLVDAVSLFPSYGGRGPEQQRTHLARRG